MSAEDMPVRLTIAPQPQYLRLARLAAASLAADLDYAIRDIDDLKVAIDELCAVLLHGATGALELSFAASPGQIVVEGAAPTEAADDPALHPIAAELLASMAEEFSVGQHDGIRRFRLVHRRDDRS